MVADFIATFARNCGRLQSHFVVLRTQSSCFAVVDG